ncbi:MAG: phosphoribosylamine--glycine ligase [Deltaproteobacteria bacterium]|nr:phosphoribosylamine--glycine ligase [Deltaproteobacteria bacterium]
MSSLDVLVVGGGGREHALAWKLAQSPRVRRIVCAPGNAGIARETECVAVPAEDVAALADLAVRERFGLVVVGPEAPLTAGLVDALAARGIRAFGPTRDGAQLEGSKAFTKDLLRDAGVATAAYETFDDPEAAHAYLARVGAPIVVKADGLAAGKGVVVAETVAEAREAIDSILRDRLFGEAGARVVLEEKLVGEEVSFLALTDGRSVLPLATSQDHKRIGDGDTGPNTGGMGAYSPAPIMTPELEREVVARVLQPVVAKLRERGIVYKGVLYAGLMVSEGRASVLEFNVRFGDPECQPLLMRLRSDLVDVVDAVIDERLHEITLDWDPRAAACVVLAAAGYPGTPAKGAVIRGLDVAAREPDTVVFHAGTAGGSGGSVVTSGGRVLGVTALGETIAEAVAAAYRATAHIHFDGMQFRRDIGRRALSRSA